MIKNLYLNIIAGSKCNRHCPFCYSNGGLLYTDNSIKGLENNLLLIKNKCEQNGINIIPTVMGGGEISLLPDNHILDILRITTQILGQKVSIITNAATFRPSLINPTYVKEINISLHDIESSTLNSIKTYFQDSKYLQRGITIVNPDLYCQLTLYALYKFYDIIDTIEVKPVEKTAYGNDTSNFKYEDMLLFLRSIAFNPILGAKLKINKADFDSELIFLTDNQIKVLVSNENDLEELKAIYNIDFTLESKTRTSCIFCKDFTWCTDEHPNNRRNCYGTKLINEFKRNLSVNPIKFWEDSDKNEFMDDLKLVYDDVQSLRVNIENYIKDPTYYDKYLMVAKPVLVYLVLKIYLELINANIFFYNDIIIKTLDTMKRNRPVNELISLAETIPTNVIRAEIKNLFNQIRDGKEISNKLLLYILVSIGYDFGINIV